MQSVEPANILAVAPRLAAETGRVGTAVDRQRALVDDFIAKEIRQRHLRGRHRIQMIRRRLIHLPFLVRQLSRRRRTRRIHENRRIHLGVTGLHVFIQKEVQQRPHDARTVTDIKREACSRHLRPSRKIEEPFEARDLPVRQRTRRHRRHVAIRRVDHILLRRAPRRDAGVRQIRDREHRLFEFFLGLLEHPLALFHLRRHRLHLGDFTDKLRRPLRQRRHRRIGALLLRPQRLHVVQLRTPRRIDHEHGIEVDLEVFLSNCRAHHVGRFTNQFGIKHGKN